MLHFCLRQHRGTAHMWILITGLVLFTVPHMLREMGLRDALIRALPSIGAYKGIYSVVALAGLALIILGKSQAPFSMVWQPLYEWRYISHGLMIPALILVVAGNLPMSHLRRQLRNPMLLGVTLWGFSHLWSNGDLASMLLFGTITLWSGFKFVVRGFTVPVVDRPVSILWDGVALATGLVFYVVISIYHGQLFGVGLNFE